MKLAKNTFEKKKKILHNVIFYQILMLFKFQKISYISLQVQWPFKMFDIKFFLSSYRFKD